MALAWAIASAGTGECIALVGSGSDPAGGLVAAVVGVGFGAIALFGTRARPRLTADADGITIGGLSLGGVGRARHHPWPFVRAVQVVRVRRLGRDTTLLEIDTVTASGVERLYVLGRLDLGDDPDDVAEALSGVRP